MLLAVHCLLIITLDYVTLPNQTNHVPAVYYPRTTTAGLKRSSYYSEVLGALQKNATLCPRMTRPTALQYRNKVWHMYQNNSQEIHIYSAFFDDRPAIGVLPYLRLFAAARSIRKPPYCHVWYDGIKTHLS